MKAIYSGILVIGIAVGSAFATKAHAGRTDTTYYQFYIDSSGNPTIFAGASEDFILAGCKFGPILCGKLYTIDDVTETSPGSGIYTVITGHEDNEVASYNRSSE